MDFLLLLLLGGTALALALILTPVVQAAAVRWDLVDRPDFRKVHKHPIPRVGGIAILLAMAGSYLLVAATVGGRFPLAAVKPFGPGVALIFLVGLADDILNLKPWVKLAGQIAAASLVVSGGIAIERVGGVAVSHWVGTATTIVWIVACTNALNLIDGVDGLASGVALVTALTTCAAGMLKGEPGLVLASMPLVGALFGFLRYNFNPASIFLGDCGSLTLGFLLASYAVLWSAKSVTLLGMAAPAMTLALPLTDVMLAFVRRFLRHQPVFSADRGHIHHRLLARGLDVRGVVFVLYAASAFSSLLALMIGFGGKTVDIAIFAVFLGGAIAGVYHLGYPELVVAGRLLFTDAFRCAINTELSLDTFRKTLGDANTVEQWWEVIRRYYADFGFDYAKLVVGGECYSDNDTTTIAPDALQVKMALAGKGYLMFSRSFEADVAKSATFANTAHKLLLEKLARQTSRSARGSAHTTAGVVLALASRRPAAALPAVGEK